MNIFNTTTYSGDNVTKEPIRLCFAKSGWDFKRELYNASVNAMRVLCQPGWGALPGWCFRSEKWLKSWGFTSKRFEIGSDMACWMCHAWAAIEQGFTVKVMFPFVGRSSVFRRMV
jgi:hypothetical protein